MRFSKVSLIIIVLIFSGLVAIACGGGEEAPSATATSAPTLAATRAPAPATATAPTATVAPQPVGSDIGKATGTILDTALDPAPFELDNVRYGGTYRASSSTSLGYLDPKYLTQINGIWPIGEKLVRWGPNEKDIYSHLEPALAEGWKSSADLKTYTMTIRKGVKWHDIPPVNGREFTADDAVFNIKRYGEKDSVKLANYSQIASVEANDRYTFTIKLKQPTAWLMNDLFPFAEWNVPPELVEEAGGTLKTKFIGTGPFILKDYKFRVGETYVRNPDYWGKDARGRELPYIDALQFTFAPDPATATAGYRTGQFDNGPALSAVGLQGLEAVGKSVPGSRLISTGPAPGAGVGFNTKKAPWNDVRVRRAFNMLIDKDRYVRAVTSSTRLYYPTPVRWADVSDKPFTPEELGPYWKFNPAEGKKLLIEAGFPDGKMKIATPLDFATPNPTFALTSQILQQLLKENGIQLELTPLTNIEYYNKWYLRKYEDLTLNFVNTGDYGLNWYAQNRFKTGGFQNMSFIEDPEVDKVVAQIQVESDPAKLRQMARFLWDYDTQGSWQIWIQNETQFSMHSPRLRNYLNRAGGGFAAPTYFFWLTDGPRTSP